MSKVKTEVTEKHLGARVKCEICGKSLSKKGLSGHMRFIHQGAAVAAQPIKEAKRQDKDWALWDDIDEW